jgi:hypothetical protein
MGAAKPIGITKQAQKYLKIGIAKPLGLVSTHHIGRNYPADKNNHMKIRYKYKVGRYVRPSDDRPINIHCGQRKDNGFDVHYFLYRGKRIFVGEDFRKWHKVSA